jgi:hypothetical protein
MPHGAIRAGLVAACLVVGPLSDAKQLPLGPSRNSGQSVTPAYEGWYRNADGTFTLLAGYFNRNRSETIDIPVGPNNNVEPGGPDQGQPTHFLPQRGWGVVAFRVPADFGTKKLTWSLSVNGESTSIPFTLNPDYEITPLKDRAIGNTPPTVRFSVDGPLLQGPPLGIAALVTARVGAAVPLVFWAAEDNGDGSAMIRRRPASAITVFLSKYRGTGLITFADVKPVVVASRVSTTVSFSEPGDYVIRVQVNNASGDGGSGFQCCWTNALVKATVTP